MKDSVVAVYGSSRAVPGDHLYQTAVELGRLLVEAGFGVTNGGYAGVMEAVSKGAAQAGGRVIGVTAPALFPNRSGGNRYLTEEVKATGLLERIQVMSRMSEAFVVMPGSIGTLTELAIAWNDAYLAVAREEEPAPILAFREAWEGIVNCLTEQLRTRPGLVTMVDRPIEVVEILQMREST